MNRIILQEPADKPTPLFTVAHTFQPLLSLKLGDHFTEANSKDFALPDGRLVKSFLLMDKLDNPTQI